MRGCGWSVARLRGLVFRIDLNLGFRSRSTPGFILMPAPQAEIHDLHFVKNVGHDKLYAATRFAD